MQREGVAEGMKGKSGKGKSGAGGSREGEGMGGEGDGAVGGGRKAARQSDAGGNRGRPSGWRGVGEGNEEKKNFNDKDTVSVPC